MLIILCDFALHPLFPILLHGLTSDLLVFIVARMGCVVIIAIISKSSNIYLISIALSVCREFSWLFDRQQV